MSNQVAFKPDNYEFDLSDVGAGHELAAPKPQSLPGSMTLKVDASALESPSHATANKVVYANFNGEGMPFVFPANCFVLSGETDAVLIDSFKSLEQKFTVPEPQEVSEFLFDFQDLMPFLEEVHSALRPIFPTEELSLKLIDDGSEAAELALFVHVDGDPCTELERLSKFQESWWLANWDRADNKVTVDLRYS